MAQKPGKTSIPPRRRLSALYERGKEVAFGPNPDDPFGEPVVRVADTKDGLFPEDQRPSEDEVLVWVRPPSPLQREEALRESSAARAKAILNAKRKGTTGGMEEIEAFLAAMETETLIDYILEAGESERFEEARRDVLAEKEWEDFTELQDSMRQWHEAGNPKTDEWEALLERDRAFGKQVRERAAEIRADTRDSLKLIAETSREELEKKAFDRRLDMVGSQAFMASYERHMLWMGVRDGENHANLFFADVDDMMSEDAAVHTELSAVLGIFITEAREAKNSSRAASGSESAEPPAEQETSEVSTPQEPTE